MLADARRGKQREPAAAASSALKHTAPLPLPWIGRCLPQASAARSSRCRRDRGSLCSPSPSPPFASVHRLRSACDAIKRWSGSPDLSAKLQPRGFGVVAKNVGASGRHRPADRPPGGGSSSFTPPRGAKHSWMKAARFFGSASRPTTSRRISLVFSSIEWSLPAACVRSRVFKSSSRLRIVILARSSNVQSVQTPLPLNG